MKKIIAILLCLALTAALFAGCSSEKDAPLSADDMNFTIDSHFSEYDESLIRSYEKLCRGVVNYEPEVKFNTAQVDYINQLFYTSFPLLALVDKVEILDDNTGVAVTYKYDEKQHIDRIKSFFTSVDEINAQCKIDEVSPDEYLFNLYTYIAQNFKVDNSVTNVMDSAITKSGINTSINGLFEYMLLQADIDTSHLLDLNSASVNTMSLSLAEFNGKMFCFNPYAEMEQNSGKGLKYFAMDSSRIKGDYLYTDQSEMPEISDDTYKKLEKCTSYSVTESKVSADCGEEKPFEFEFKPVLK